MAEAILHRFVQNGAYAIITTHYQNLKHYAKECPTVVNGAMLYNRAEMQPLFMLQVGNPGSSFAVEIARKIGIPEDVISYASDLVGKDYIMSDKYLQDIVRDKMYWETKRKNIHKREKQLEETVARYEEEMESFKHEKKEVMAKAKEQAQHLLEESNAKIEKTIRDIREAQAEKERTREARKELKAFSETMNAQDESDDVLERKIAKIKRRQERKKNKSKEEKPNTGNALQALVAAIAQAPAAHKATRNLVVGDFVRIKGQSAVGKIDSISGKSAKVLFGMMYTTISVNRLELTSAPKEDKTTFTATFVSKETRDAMHEKKLHFKPEIDLRGMRTEEALTATAYFIDDAIQCEQAQVRILHGTGSGILRQMIRKYLASVPGVRNFHDEHVQFGGAGITVVELD
ncbi:MutS2 family protein [gut metagenome]|uniref:MutS2 family protein n=1 Tax=gut metagenome TaxID=749906 RepID=J9G923_9ZZZZ